MKKRSMIIVTLLVALQLLAYASTNNSTSPKSEQTPSNNSQIDTTATLDASYLQSDEVMMDILNEKIDSMARRWYVRHAFAQDSVAVFEDDNRLNIIGSEFEFPDSFLVTHDMSDSLIIERLQALNSLIDLSYNPMVKEIINYYTGRRKEKLQIILGLATYYFPMFEEILDKYDLPLELKYMAVIESALNPVAFSKAGACGLWQFMHGTGKMYGLEVSTYIDERRDPLKATDAAARYLRDLYNIYGDWHLVIAAYNCGPGNVNKAIARSGGKRDYWSIYYRLPKETRGYVPAYIAASYVMNYYKSHGINPQQPSFKLITDTIVVNNYIHFNQLANELNIDITMLRDLNPVYRRDVIPARPDKTYVLRLPQENIAQYLAREEQILASEREKYFPNNKIKEPEKNVVKFTPAEIKGKDKVFYTVQSGDNVGFISSWFNVRLSDLKYWNNMSSNMLKAGQKLEIYVPSGKGDYYSGFNDMSFDEKQAAIGKSTSKISTSAIAASNSVSTTEASATTEEYEFYTVRKGDNLWTIAKKYPGVTAEEIKKLNNISDTKGLAIGQSLKIRKNN